MLWVMALGLATAGRSSAGEESLRNGGFEGEWRDNVSNWEEAVAEGLVPEQWEDVSTWSGAHTSYGRIAGREGGNALRLEMVQADTATSLLQLRSGFPVQMTAGEVCRVTAWLRSETATVVSLEIRQHQEPRIRFWEMRVRPTDQWQEFSFIAEPTETGEARFFLVFREPGAVEVDDLSVDRLTEDERPAPTPPAPVVGSRCVRTRGDLIRHSDIIAMYQEGDPEVLRKYLIDVVAWGGQLRATDEQIAKRKELLEAAYDAGVRLHAVDCAMVQEGGRFVISEGDRQSPNADLFWELRKDNAGTIAKLGELGVDLTRDSVLNVAGDWIGVPWLRKRWRIPMASVHSPRARQWFREHMEAIAKTGATALHFDEPAMGSYGVQHPEAGDYSAHAMVAFRQWLKDRPEEVWREAGVESLDEFDYREFVLRHGGEPRRAPLWREFVRFQLFTTRDHVRELRDIVRETVGTEVPLSMNANASSWVKLPFLELQDFMTTEVPHEAKGRRVPSAPLLVYKLADCIGQPVASTAMGHDWYEMKTDQHPVLVSSWLAMGYALGHHPMMPCKAWVMDPVKGSDTYRPVSDEYACMARFIKGIAHLLEGYEPVSVVSVVVGCDAIEKDALKLRELVKRLADEQVPFSMAIEGSDLLERQVSAGDLGGVSAVLLAGPTWLSEEAIARAEGLAGERPCLPYHGGGLPGVVPRPVRVEGAEGVWALPRQVPGDAEAPLVLHLLNRDYDEAPRAMVAKGPFTVDIDEALLDGRQVAGATMYEPVLLPELPADDALLVANRDLEVQRVDGALRLTVPSLDLWGVVALD